MRTIMLLNRKGGSGKSTLAANLASYYAQAGKKVVLADFDPQGSSMDWLAVRPAERPPITGIAAWEGPLRVPRGTEVLIMDAPSGLSGRALSDMVRRAQTLVIPVLPSPIDIRAASRFVGELLTVGRVSRQQTRLGVVANRVRENTLVYHQLVRFLRSLKIPFLATLRETQNYIRAEERGLGIFEMAPSQVERDLAQWRPLLRWLGSRRSLPNA